MTASVDTVALVPVVGEIVKGVVSVLGAMAVLATPIGVILTKIATSKQDSGKKVEADMQATIDGMRTDMTALRCQLEKTQQMLNECYQSRQGVKP